MAPVSIYESLRTLEPLRRGKCDARETPKILPVPDEMLDAVRPYLTRPVRALVELQLLTGARPGELVGRHARDIDMDPTKPAAIQPFSRFFRSVWYRMDTRN